MKINKLLIVLITTASAGIANASCYGSANYYNCQDSSGNNYSVSRYGNTTQVNGYNSSTGSTWNQTSQRYGNTTQTYGTAANGQHWNSTSTPYGSYGTDSNGRSFNCSKIGNQTFCN